LNDIVPHESMNMYGIKSGIDVEIDPASDAPIAVFDGKLIFMENFC
jgi:hypothetical protein